MVFSKSMTFDVEEFRETASAVSPIAFNSSDAEFIEKLKVRDNAAYEQLIERYSGEIFALLYRFTENAEDAADLTQETFLRVVRSIHKFRGDSELKTWLYRIAINESRNRYRWWKRRRRDSTTSIDATIGNSDMTISDTIADQSISPEDEVLRRERESALEIALLEVPMIYREAVILCDIEGLTYDETANVLDISLGTVKSRISRGREVLRNRLKDF